MSLPSRKGFPIYDRQFELTPQEALNIWEAANRIESKSNANARQGNNNRRILDGAWIIERSPLGPATSPGQRIEDVKTETKRFRETGLHVISFAIAAAPEGWGTYSVGPLPKTERPCPEHLQRQVVLPRLRAYFGSKIDADIELQASDPNLDTDNPINFFSQAADLGDFSVLKGRPSVPYWNNLGFEIENTNRPLDRELFISIIASIN